MLEMIKMRRDALKETMKVQKGSQKGLTLIELLIVLVIIIVLIAMTAIAFTFFGQVDGTELAGNSKKVQDAVIQTALTDENRDTPAVYDSADFTATDAGKQITRTDSTGKVKVLSTLKSLPKTVFEDSTDASVVLSKVAADNDISESDLLALLRPVNTAKVKINTGKAKAADYFVVVRKSQLYANDALVGKLANYNDELANQVFSKKTIIDKDGNHYNGTFKAKKPSTP